MQHTEKYKFNLIETSDAFSPDALNENAEAAERELAAIRSEFAAADASVRSAFAAADNTLSSRLSTAEAGAKLVHLLGPRESDSSSYFTVNLSGINLSQYRALLIFTKVAKNQSYGMITIGNAGYSFGGGSPVIWLFNASGKVAANPFTYTGNDQWASLTQFTLAYLTFLDIYGVKV